MFLVGLLFLGMSPGILRAKEEGFSFIVLGDIHYAKSSHYDLEQLRQQNPSQVNPVKYYYELTGKYFRPFLEDTIKEQIKKFNPPIKFIVQVGDLVQGIVTSEEHARRQFQDIAADIKNTNLGAPFLVARGNHEFTGSGMEKAYQELMFPFLSEELGSKVEKAYYSFNRANCHFIVLDTDWQVLIDTKPQLKWLGEDLEAHRDASHTFIFIHSPLVPIARGWQVGRGRASIFELLRKYEVDATFCGHLHRYSYLSYSLDEGKLIQIMIDTVLLPDISQPLKMLKNYGPQIIESGFEKEGIRKLFTEEAKKVVHFKSSPSCDSFVGYLIVSIEKEEVTVRAFRGLGKELYEQFTLNSL